MALRPHATLIMRAFIIAAALVALPSRAMGVSLSDFKLNGKEIPNLSTRCDAAYRHPISGCSDSDFRGANCNAVCVKGVQAITKSIQASCGSENFGDDTESENVIVCFLAGSGLQKICPNNDIPVVSSTSRMTARTTTTHLVQSSTATSPPEQTSMTSYAKPSSTETFSSTFASLTATPPQEATGAASSTTNPSSSTTSISQNDGSGGGSPFDEPSDAVISPVPMAMALLTVILLAAGMN